jgi:hypothetical protein
LELPGRLIGRPSLAQRIDERLGRTGFIDAGMGDLLGESLELVDAEPGLVLNVLPKTGGGLTAEFAEVVRSDIPCLIGRQGQESFVR